MKYFRNVIITVILLTLVVVGFLVKTFYDAGEFRKIGSHFDGQYISVKGVLSSEDITIDPQTGMAFISSADRRVQWSGGKLPRQGAIYGFDLNSENPELVNLTAKFSKEFNPHGIGLWVMGDKLAVFAVNHCREGHYVEVFDFREGKLIHRESVAGPLMNSPNDVLPVGKGAFYVTNDHGSSSGLGHLAEEYLQLARSFVLYYDGKNFRKVAERLAYANGINMSTDGKTVYVAATVGQKVYVYDRDTSSGDLTPRHTIQLDTGVDNIEIDENGDLWIGAHPKLLTFVKYSRDQKKISPSQVLKVSIKDAGRYTVEEIYLDSGRHISGASVAATFKDMMLVGSVFDARFLFCRLNHRRNANQVNN
jgi:arylesterase/paraoxonase